MGKFRKGIISGWMLFVFLVPGYGQQVPGDSLDRMIGQMIMVGVGDSRVLTEKAPVLKYIREGKVGGIILFEKNISKTNSRDFLKQLIVEAQSQAPVPLLVAIDEEGGRVNRLKTKYGFPKTVTAQYLGSLDNPDTTWAYAFRTATTLKDLGINMNFAPTVDVNVNPTNPVIGGIGRSYSADEQKVVKHAARVMDAHDSSGVVTVLKHFPGHGSSKADTHLGVADVSHTWQLRELYPYHQLIDSGKVQAIMTAHIVNYALDSAKLPATLSKQVVGGLLRGLLHYDGVVVSDDMQMGAIADHYGLEEAIRLAISAGVDLLLFANNVPNHDQADAAKLHSIIRKLVDSGQISEQEIIDSYQRMMILKANLGLIRLN